MQKRVYTIIRRIAHHAEFSGYEQIVPYLGTPIEPPEVLRKVRGLGWFHRYLRKRSGMEWYDGFYAELTTAWHMRKHPPSIYHFLYAENQFRYLPALASLNKHSLIGSFHSTPNEFKKILRSTEHLKSMRAAVVVSQVQIPHLQSVFGKENVFFIPLGVDVNYFRPAEQVHRSTKTCICVGHHHRDLKTLCATAALIKASDPKVRIHLIDRAFHKYLSPEDQRFYRNAFASTGNLTLETDVSEDRLLHYYQTSDLMLLPLTDSTANFAILEGMSCGLPMVVTDVGGVRDYVDDQCAAFAAPQDATALADQVIRLLSDNSERHNMSVHCRQKALAFHWPRIADQMKSIYSKLDTL